MIKIDILSYKIEINKIKIWVKTMKFYKLRYLTSFFTNAIDIEPNQETMQNLINRFKTEGLLPTFFQELTNNGKFLKRLLLISPNNEKIIRFATKRIDFEKLATENNGLNPGEIKDFCEEAINLFDSVSSLFNKKSNRLSLVTTYLFKDLNETQVKQIHDKLFKTPNFFTQNDSTEWNWRNVAHKPVSINGRNEMINYILSINFVTGQENIDNTFIDFKGINMDIDINTSPINEEYRFSKDDLVDFYTNVHKWQKELFVDTLNHMELTV
ncbi:MAG: hypothetical protein GYA62_05110 [Bacteroidales bacterium]|nr:hypothetical protein [Bacteroidales bacterium]